MHFRCPVGQTLLEAGIYGLGSDQRHVASMLVFLQAFEARF